MLWLLFLYTHNQYNYSNNYQIINYSLKGYLLAEQCIFLSPLFDWVLLFNVFCFCVCFIIIVIIVNINIILLLLLILFSFYYYYFLLLLLLLFVLFCRQSFL